jgi:arylsulfatase A-like enzyme
MIKNGYQKERSGDLLFTLKPNWIIWGRKTGTTHGMPYEYDTHVPLIFYGKKIKHGDSQADIKITDIAPTVCKMLDISITSGCTGKVTEELVH